MLRVVVLLVLSVILIGLNASDADARRRIFGRQSRNSYDTTYTAATTVSITGGPQSVAEAKASQAASWLTKGHLGGSFGGGNAEGVGFSTHSAAAALSSCCYTGQRPVLGSACVRGADGWYACKIYQ